jgi:hypothetical protein
MSLDFLIAGLFFLAGIFILLALIFGFSVDIKNARRELKTEESKEILRAGNTKSQAAPIIKQYTKTAETKYQQLVVTEMPVFQEIKTGEELKNQWPAVQMELSLTAAQREIIRTNLPIAIDAFQREGCNIQFAKCGALDGPIRI